jgi:alkanesulfonate monooxygenase SsuD/methylene tetrahydromethanopterin reductase-like flavin-dependent oxidoreductase (luciferase family)
MRLGYFTMPLHPPGSDIARTLADDLEQLEVLDRLGYAEAWVGEHFTSEWENIPCPDLFLAQAIGRTKNIVLGTGVSCLPNHNPLMLAQRIAQLDQMAKGRFAWGIGAGGFPGDFELFDVDMEHGEGRRLTREVLDAVLELWSDPKPGSYDHARWHYQVPAPQPEVGIRLHLRPYQTPHPPIAVAGVSPRSDTLAMAGERDWIPMSINFIPTATLAGHWDAYSSSAIAAGNQPRRANWRIARDILIADTNEKARRLALDGVLARDWRDYFIPLLTKGKLLKLAKIDAAMSDDAVTLEYLCDNMWIVGDVETVTAKLRRLYDDVGGFGTLLAIGHEWYPREEWLQSMQLLATEVVPRLAA